MGKEYIRGRFPSFYIREKPFTGSGCGNTVTAWGVTRRKFERYCITWKFVLVLAGLELIFFVVPGMGLCF